MRKRRFDKAFCILQSRDISKCIVLFDANFIEIAKPQLRLSAIIGTSPQFWINLQARYDLESTKDKLADRIDREVRPRERAA